MIELNKILRLQSLMTEHQRIIEENGTQWTPVEHANVIGDRIKKIWQGMTKQEKEWYNENESNLLNIDLTLIDIPGKLEKNKLNFPCYDLYAHKKEYFGEYLYSTKFRENSNQHLYKFIPIPKNAGFWISDILIYLGWTKSNVFENDFTVTKDYNIVVLRDPIERWCSGIASYLVKHQSQFVDEIFQKNLSDSELFSVVEKNAVIQLLFDKISFDLSTEKQVYFLHNLDRDKTVFFYLNENFSNNFSNFFNQELQIKNFFYTIPPDNKTFEEGKDTPASFLCKNFQRIIQKNPYYLNLLKEYYQQDYELIKSVNFYAN